MDGFYELKPKKPSTKKDVNYWEARCKEAEAQNLELNQALINAAALADGLTSTIAVLEEFIQALGYQPRKGHSLGQALRSKGIGVEFHKGTIPGLYTFETAGKPHRLWDIRGVEVELSLNDGLRVGPHFEDR